MIKCLLKLVSASFICLSMAPSVQAMPSDGLLHKVSQQVVKVRVALEGGRYGTGSGVVIAKDRIVTNCHVVANALHVSITFNGISYTANAMTPDWYHDLCLVKVEGLDAPIATIGSSRHLAYEQAVFTVGYPNASPTPSNTFGSVKGLFAMDDSVVIRASSTFSLGSSGGGMFDDDGHLVGIITLKSPGKQVYYYYMPVEWVQALLDKPEEPISTPAQLTFWASQPDKWPYFMQVVQPYLTGNWVALLTVAKKWRTQEPSNHEALFYLAAAEYAVHNLSSAQVYLQQVIVANAKHSQAIYYLTLIAQESDKPMEAWTNVALAHLEPASKLKSAIFAY